MKKQKKTTKKKKTHIGGGLSFVKVRAMGKFFDSIEDYVLQEKIWGYFVKFGNQGGVSNEEWEELKKLLVEAKVSEEEFLKLTKQIRR